VVGVDAKRNRVVVGDAHDLMTEAMRVREVNWVSCSPVTAPRDVDIKIRYRAKPAQAHLVPGDNGSATVTFRQPQRAVTPGQTAAFYAGDVLLGGGIIDR